MPRLAEHLGTFGVELIKSRAAPIMADRATLAGLNSMSALLVEFLPEREPNEAMYQATHELVEALAGGNPYWPILYAHWELSLLDALGFGLDLTSCASTGTREDLTYVSPRSGRAVCRSAGGPFADRMLPLPAFLIRPSRPNIGDVREALRTTGYFLEKMGLPAIRRQIPAPGARPAGPPDGGIADGPAAPPGGRAHLRRRDRSGAVTLAIACPPR